MIFIRIIRILLIPVFIIALIIVAYVVIDSSPKIRDPLVHKLNKISRNRAKKRIESIREMGKSGSEKYIPKFIRFLHNKDREIQSAAEYGLVKIGNPVVPYVVPHLNNVYPMNRSRVVSVLARIGNPEAVTALESMLGDESPVVRATLARELNLNKDPRSLNMNIQLLNDENSSVCRNAIINLSRHSRKDATDLVIPFINHPDHKVSVAAIRALSTFRDSSAVPALIGLLDEPSSLKVTEAVKALGSIKDPRAVEPLVNRWERSRGIGAARVLDSFNYKPADLDKRLDFFLAIGAWKRCVEEGSIAIDHLKSKITHGHTDAAKALGDIIKNLDLDPNTVLREHLDSPRDKERAAAIEAVGMLDSREAVPILIEQLRERHKPNRTRVVQLLLKRDDSRIWDVLIETVRDDSFVPVRIEAVKGLASSLNPTLA